MKKLVVLLVLGFLVRFAFVSQPGFAADVAYWKSWSLAAAQKGLVWTTLETNYNYAPAFLYFLKGIGLAYDLLADPNNFNEYWQATNYPFLLVSKLPIILADLLTAYGLWWLLKRARQFPQKLSVLGFQLSIPLLAAAYYLFNPFIIFEGAFWGQVGSIGTSLIFLAMILLFKKRPLPATAVATLAFLLKLQMMFFLPLILLWIFKKHGWPKFVSSLATATGVFFLVSLPFILQQHMEKVFTLIISSALYFPLLSLNAYNFWWLYAKGDGFSVSDRVLVFGNTSANFLSLFVFLVFFLLASARLWQKTSRVNFYKAGLWVSFAFFMLPTQMHERYIYPAFLFLALLIPEISRLYQEKKRGLKTYFYILLCLILPISGFYNLHTVLIQNYPEFGFQWLAFTNQGWLTMVVAVIHSVLFLGLSWILFKEIKPRWRYSIVAGGLLILIAKQTSFSLAEEVPLGKILPIWQQQDYAIPMKNLTIYSGWGPKHWSFLSNNYYFYRQGFGTHANSKLVFPLRGQFKRFSVDIGVDTEGGENASVIFNIFGDGELLYSSSKMGKFDLTRHVEVSVKGVQNLELNVGDAGDGITNDHADWLNPVLYKN